MGEEKLPALGGKSFGKKGRYKLFRTTTSPVSAVMREIIFPSGKTIYGRSGII